MRLARLVLSPLTLLSLALLGGCSSSGPPGAEAPKTTAAALQKGTAVPLMLLRQIEAGGSREGLLVPFMITEDVKDAAGNVLIPKGTIAEGEVSWSRSEGTLSGMMRQPARLEVRLKHTRGASNETIPLCADAGDPEKPFAFTRDNTGRPEMNSQSFTDDVLQEAVVKALSEFAETGEVSSLNASTDARLWLIEASKQPGMEAARAFLDPDSPQKASAEELEKVVRHVRDGSLRQLAGGEIFLAVNALEQLGSLAHSVERSLASKLKGRTIKAYAGTPVTAYAAQDVKVQALAPR